MPRKSILLVDDEQVILHSLARDLRFANPRFMIGQASGGREAITKIHDRPWDMVITDMIMPGCDGFQVLESAKQKNSLTMVIILTGYADLDAAIGALRLGADDFLQKPCDSDELLYRMANCFAKQDLQQKLELYEEILPVCSYCKKIRKDPPNAHGRGQWLRLEEYFHQAQGVMVSHGICPDCLAGSLSPDNGGTGRPEAATAGRRP